MSKKRTPHSVDYAVIEENLRGKPNGSTISAFAHTLNRLLAEKEIDQEQMADDLKMSEGAISNYRNGKAEPKLSAIIKIAKYLNVDCNYLMTGIQSQHISLGDIGFSGDAISKIMSFMPDGEEVECFESECMEDVNAAGNLRTSDMCALNALIESKSFQSLLFAVRVCTNYSDFPTPTEQLIDVMCDSFPNADKSEIFKKFKMDAICQAEADCRDLAIFNVQRAATMIAEELCRKTRTNK